MKNILIFSSIFLLFSCKNNTDISTEVKNTHEEIQANNKENPLLYHLVFLKLKDSISQERIVGIEKAIKEIGTLKGVHDFHLGKPADTGDARLYTDYDYMLSMYFDKIEDLKSYSKDSTHLEIRKAIKDDLKQAPMVVDYWGE